MSCKVKEDVQNRDYKYKIVYCTPALYMAGGVERVLTLKANYFADKFGYDVTIILTEGNGRPLFYPLSYGLVYHYPRGNRGIHRLCPARHGYFYKLIGKAGYLVA